jgi:NADPH:quinone reductase-like Zn-dependent oxidoreductase
MSAMGFLPGLNSSIGTEVAGLISELGSGAAARRPGLAPGTRAIALALRSGAPGAASHVTAPAEMIVPLPDGVPLAEAAGYLGTHLAARYALVDRARLAAGDTLLLHSALGGMGQAALRIAQRVGCRIIASAGSAAKRERLAREPGVVAVLDSRAPPASWGPTVAAATGGRGADVVLNSLSGAGLVGSLALVAPGGRFVEVGKRDILGGTPLDLSLLKRNISFISAHIDILDQDDPAAFVEVS